MRSALLVALAGCFGTGPEPTVAPEATLLFALPPAPQVSPECEPAQFIGNIALGDINGYAVTHTVQPSCDGGGGGGSSPQLISDVYEFSKTSGNARVIEQAGPVTIGGGHKPRIAALGTQAVWTAQMPQGSSELRSNVGGPLLATLPNQSSAASIVMDAGTSYLAMWNVPLGPTFPNDPRYPCCEQNGEQQAGFGFFAVSTTGGNAEGMPVSPMIFCEQMKNCLVGNADTLFYLEHVAPMGGVIRSQPKDRSPGTDIAMVPEPPSGLDADATHVVWSTTVDFADVANRDPIPARCRILVATVAPPHMERALLETERFSCLDVALDGDAIYFTIVAMSRFDKFATTVLNRGLGRVSIATGELETLELGIVGPEAGPRQVFVDGDDLIVVAPYAVARIAKSALDGRREIDP